MLTRSPEAYLGSLAKVLKQPGHQVEPQLNWSGDFLSYRQSLYDLQAVLRHPADRSRLFVIDVNHDTETPIFLTKPIDIAEPKLLDRQHDPSAISLPDYTNLQAVILIVAGDPRLAVILEKRHVFKFEQGKPRELVSSSPGVHLMKLDQHDENIVVTSRSRGQRPHQVKNHRSGVNQPGLDLTGFDLHVNIEPRRILLTRVESR